jgi:hypothetical protein
MAAARDAARLPNCVDSISVSLFLAGTLSSHIADRHASASIAFDSALLLRRSNRIEDALGRERLVCERSRRPQCVADRDPQRSIAGEAELADPLCAGLGQRSGVSICSTCMSGISTTIGAT